MQGIYKFWQNCVLSQQTIVTQEFWLCTCLIRHRLVPAGGTLAQLLEDLIRRGAAPEGIRVVTVVAAPPALQRLSPLFPGARIMYGEQRWARVPFQCFVGSARSAGTLLPTRAPCDNEQPTSIMFVI